MSDTGPDDLKRLGDRLNEVQRLQVARSAQPSPPASIAIRLGTELIAALAFGSALGWGIDWLFGHFGVHTKPLFLITFFMLGAGAGFLGVIRTAQRINSPVAPHGSRSAATEDRER